MFGPLKCKTLRLAKVWKLEGFTYGCGVLWVKPGSDGTQEIETIANAGRSLGAGSHRCPSVATRVFEILKTGSVV